MRRIRVRTPSGGAGGMTTYVHMTVLAVREAAHRERRTSQRPGRGSRFGRDDLQLREIRERLEHDDYAIDPDAVAEAILRRLLAGKGELV
jgi:hypothetical protein